MSDKKKFERRDAMPVAVYLRDHLAPFCERIEIAGSLRRGKPEVGDIEILYVPKFDEIPAASDLFAKRIVDRVAQRLEVLIKGSFLKQRPNKNGTFTWGPHNKLAIHIPSSIPVDFFATRPENWWVSLVIRTGSKETNMELTRGARRLGKTLNAYGCGVTDPVTVEVTPATSERHVFELCGVPYKEPKDR